MRKPKSSSAAGGSDESSSKTFNVRAIDRALSILLLFRSSDPALSLTEVAQRSTLDKGTARRILLTLVERKFLLHEPLRKKYMLGPAIAQLAATVTQKYDFRDLVRPALTTLGDRARACINFAVRRDLDAVNVERYEPRGAFIMPSHWQIGSRLPLNMGAAPRVLMAAMPDSEIDAILADRSRHSAFAQPVKPRKIRSDLERIRKDGWAASIDEYAVGVTAIGAPIKNAAGKVVAAVSMIGLTPQLVVDGEFVYLRDLLALCDKLSGNEGFNTDLPSLETTPPPSRQRQVRSRSR